ncbi:protein containing Initiation factor eIF2 gamma, partial [mine drainage metagenome]
TEEMNVEPIKSKESLMLTVGTSNTVGIVTSARDGSAEIILKYPVAARENERIAIARRVENRWRLIGYGNIISL